MATLASLRNRSPSDSGAPKQKSSTDDSTGAEAIVISLLEVLVRLGILGKPGCPFTFKTNPGFSQLKSA